MSCGSGDQLLILGDSGSGKTTLLHLICGLLKARSGSIEIGGVDVSGLGDREMDKFIGNVVSQPRKKIKEFVAFVKDNYFAPEGVEVDNEDFIRRWNGAYEVLNVQD